MNASYPILRKDELTPVTSRFVIEAPWIASSAQPGQFIIVRVHDHGERMPVTLADFDPKAGTVTVVVQEVGRTSRLFRALKAGEAVLDVAGPLGEPYPLRSRGTVVGVGGGFGVAALLPVLRGLKAKGVRAEAVIGARSKALLIMERELAVACDQVWPCTDDGTYGYPGFVTNQLKKRLTQEPRVDEIAAIGPLPMMRAVTEVGRSAGIPVQVSLDPIMVDGTGMCGGCRVTVGSDVKFACVDGPFFDGRNVDFNELTLRNRAYVREQSIALGERPLQASGDRSRAADEGVPYAH